MGACDSRLMTVEDLATAVAARVGAALDKVRVVLESFIANVPAVPHCEKEEAETMRISAAVTEALKEKERGESIVVSNATGVSHR
eukprot:3274522-Amphidinium_carterae.1